MTKKHRHNQRVTLIPAMRSAASEPLRLCVSFLLSAIMLVLLPACADKTGIDDPNNPTFEEGIPTEVRITLSSRPNNAQTRGDGTPKDPTSSVELIHDWWIVFVNPKNGDVKVITDKDEDVYDKVPSTSVNVDGDGYEAETFRTIIPSGTYRVYAFANITPKTATEFKNNYLKQNSKGEWQHKDIYVNTFVLKAFRENEDSPNKDMQWFDKITNDKGNEVNNNIPMTQVMPTIVITNTVEDAINIEVVRAVAKVEFAFTNSTNDNITLEELKFGRISNSEKISIVPNNSAVGIGPNDKLNKNIKEKDKGTLSFENISLTNDESGKYNMGMFSFYCKESLGGYFKENGDPVTVESEIEDAAIKNVFKIELKVKKTKAGETSEISDSKTFYTSKITYINRHDWIHIHIKFTNWVIKWNLHYYPPLGGYPPVFNQSADGTSLSATLTTGGEFELYPVEVIMDDKTYEVDMDNTNMSDPETSGDDLFIKAPKLVDNLNKDVTGHPLSAFGKIIAGELDPKKTGTAKVKITFFLKDQDGQALTEAKTCIFTIIRQNSPLTP